MLFSQNFCDLCYGGVLLFECLCLFFFLFLQHAQMWHRLDMYGYGYYYRRCFWYDADVSREDGRLLLMLGRVQTWSSGVYRCVSDNITDLDNSSLPFKLTVHCEFFLLLALDVTSTLT